MDRLGIFLQRFARYEEAEAAYRKAVEADPEYSWAWLGLGSVMEQLGRITEAGRACLQRLRLEPAEPTSSLTRVCERLTESGKDLLVAEELAVEAWKLQPTDNAVAFLLACIFVLEGNERDGEVILRKPGAR